MHAEYYDLKFTLSTKVVEETRKVQTFLLELLLCTTEYQHQFVG